MTSAPHRDVRGVDVVPPPPGYRLAELDDTRDRRLIQDVDRWGFAFEPDPNDAEREVWTLEPGRSVGVWDERGTEARLAAVHSSYAFQLPVPGGRRLPTSGLTWVAVHPGHRRRGLARAMVTAHLARSVARGEVLSALYAAEAAIYGRYGYGIATQFTRLQVPRGRRLHTVAGSEDLLVELDTADAGRHGADLDRVHRAVQRPGWITRDTDALRTSHLTDRPSARRDAERLRVAVVRTVDGEPRGYAVFRRANRWSQTGLPDGRVTVHESAALDPAAARALWGTLTDLDLMGTVETGDLALDDPLVHLLGDLRGTNARVHDGVWIRILDLPAVLATRTYAAPVDVVLEVTDAVVPANAGRWHLRGTGSAEITRTDEPAHLAIDVADLASVYLGTFSLAALAGAGRVQELVPGHLAAAATAFGWPVAPANSWGF
ncbi:GNAT family N-acetyltransferase [Georgenia alba]|uniref:GNAT family N-acetyltransferase n=1 Tax=Georgenia alba TaxID=2233858 RepID=A0ABW2Q7Q7_9MICO